MHDKAVCKGEVSGSFLLGLTGSFAYLNILPQDLDIDGLEPEQWYPYSLLMSILDSISKNVPYSDIIFFYAGVNFINIWYENGPGKDMIASGLDWLYAHHSSAGYNSVVRGGTPEEIGWSKIQSFDLEAGIAVYENVMPLLPEFVKGVFYGGCLLFDDMEYVEVDATSQPYEKNPSFIKTILTVKFYPKTQASQTLDKKIKNASNLNAAQLSSQEIETLLWRNKGLEIKNQYELQYHNAIGKLLSESLTTVRQKAQTLEKLNKEVEYLANYDLLTGLPTRRLATDRLKMICSQRKRKNIKHAVLFLDLDGFKAVNDTYWHDAGDFVLTTVSQRLQRCLRQNDTVARLGGDELLFLMSDFKSKDDIAFVAQKIIDVVSKGIDYKGHLITIGVSIGISIIPDDGVDHDAVLKKADDAMYDVKSSGKNSFTFYNEASCKTIV